MEEFLSEQTEKTKVIVDSKSQFNSSNGKRNYFISFLNIKV